MKKQLLLILVTGISSWGIAQAPPSISVGPSAGQSSGDYWSRAGNNTTGNNIFGLKVNSPIYTVTGNGFNLSGAAATTYRTKINGIFTNPGTQYPINGFGWTQGVNTTGYMLIGYNINNFYQDKGAFSLLHLNGQDAGGSGAIQEFGYRPWMQTGITLTGNSDLSYMGMRQLGTTQDVTETVFAISDNAGSISGPDEIAFRYLEGNGSSYNTDFTSADDMDGRHLARFTGGGYMGLGNTFGVNVGSTVNYAQPMSLMHQSFQFATGSGFQGNGFHQITYRRALGATTDIIGQGEAATDGLRLGIDNVINTGGPQSYLNSYLRWQEASNFIIQTEDDATPNIQANERLRVTSIGAMNSTQNALNYDGLTTPTNATRISISESGATPLQRPKSLLHLGYDYGGVIGVQGYRKWMDLGVLTSNQRDHVWLGLKSRTVLTTTVPGTYDQLDAVVAWGTDREATAPASVDNMRFIFTGHTFDANPEGAPSTSTDGLEMMRMYPATVYNHPVYSGGTLIGNEKSYGRVGIGDFTASGVNQEPTQKLDVVGNARLRYLPDSVYLADSTVDKIVMVGLDGLLRWKSFVPSEFGTYCADTVRGKLNADKKVVLNNFSLYFTNGQSPMNLNENRMGLGYPCGTILPGKLAVRQLHDQQVGVSTTAGHFYNSDTANTINLRFIGALGRADGKQNPNLRSWNIGGSFSSESADINIGVQADARAGFMSSSNNMGGNFNASFGSVSTGLVSQGSSGTFRSIGVSGVGSSPSTPSQIENIGGQFTGSYSTETNYGVKSVGAGGNVAIGVYGTASGANTNWAGYFDGNVYISGFYGPSDQNLKENVAAIEHADSLIKLLNPVTFDFKTADYPQLNLQNGSQMGLIAQQVEAILPNVVKENVSPAVYDSIGNVIYPSVNFKTVDYTKLVPLLISGHQLQADAIQAKDSIIDSLRNEVNDLNNRLTQLENCLSGILPYLCQLSQSAVQANTPAAQEEVRKNLNVTLSNRNAIVLDQNVPNPFAEQTVINFSIPESVKKAQIHFYDGNGRFMNSVEVVERGLGSITVFGSDLSTGVYTYTLVADGQVVATKKMMKQ